jgi:hypothetical protein
LADKRLRAPPEQLCDALGACTQLNPVYRRLVKMALEELRLIDEQIGRLDLEMASLLSKHQDAVQRLAEVPGLGVDSAQQIIAEVGPNISLREMSLLVGRCLPGRRRERGRQPQTPLSKGQPPHATLTQSSCECGSPDQRKPIRDRVSPLGPAPATQSSHRSHCTSTVSTDLADPASFGVVGSQGPPFLRPNLRLTSIPQQLPILEHAVASAAPAASSKSRLLVLTLAESLGGSW